jgi:hypothetical protein
VFRYKDTRIEERGPFELKLDFYSQNGMTILLSCSVPECDKRCKLHRRGRKSKKTYLSSKYCDSHARRMSRYGKLDIDGNLSITPKYKGTERDPLGQLNPHKTRYMKSLIEAVDSRKIDKLEDVLYLYKWNGGADKVITIYQGEVRPDAI